MKDIKFLCNYEISSLIKKLFILVFLFAFGILDLSSQCKLIRTKNEFSASLSSVSSKDVTIASVFPILGSKKPWNLDMSFLLVTGSVSISVTHKSQSYSTSLHSINFKFDDGTIINKGDPGSSGDYDTGFGYEYTYTLFNVTKEDLEIFATKKIVKIQAFFNNFPDYPNIEGEIKTKNAERIVLDASCMLDELKSVELDSKNKESNQAVSNYECKFDKDIVDDFTKQRSVLTKPATIGEIKMPDGRISWFIDVCGSNINGKNGLTFSRGLNNFVTFGDGGASIGEACKFNQADILFEDGEVLSLKDEIVSEFTIDKIAYRCRKNFSVSDTLAWEKLKTKTVKKIRFSLNGIEKITQELDKKNFESIEKVVNCISTLGIPKQ